MLQLRVTVATFYYPAIKLYDVKSDVFGKNDIPREDSNNIPLRCIVTVICYKQSHRYFQPLFC